MAENATPKKRRGGGPRPNSGGARPGAGRPPYKFSDEDRRLVEAMAGYGVPLEQIACLIGGGIDRETLTRHFSTEIKHGKAKTNSKIGQTLYQRAINGDTTAAIWWTKTQMGWKDTSRVEHTGANGAPLTLTEAPSETLLKLVRAVSEPPKLVVHEEGSADE